MTLIDFFVLLVVAGICGTLAQTIVGYSRRGCLVSIALGFVGAIVGSYLARWLQLPEMFTLTIGSQRFPIIWSIIGGTLFVAVIGFLRIDRVWRA